MTKALLAVLVAAGVLGAGPCESGGGTTGLLDRLVTGTWGGENAGLIADDTSAHVHIACTYGWVHQGIEPDGGRFDVPGEYVLRAYPVAVGPSLPARFQGSVRGIAMTLSVVVTDTTAGRDSTVTLGPVKLLFGREPKMQMCPICRRTSERQPM